MTAVEAAMESTAEAGMTMEAAAVKGAAMPVTMTKIVGEPEATEHRLIITGAVITLVVIAVIVFAVIGRPTTVAIAIIRVVVAIARAFARIVITRGRSVVTRSRHTDANTDRYARVGRSGRRNRCAHRCTSQHERACHKFAEAFH